MKQRIKLGVVGVGHMGYYHVKVAQSLPAYELIGIQDTNSARAQQVAKEFDVQDFSDVQPLLEQSEAIVISAPTKNHFPMAKLALQNHCHILVEKPMTDTVEQAEELVRLSDQYARILQVGHVERFNGAVRELSKIVENPILIEARRISPFNSRIQDTGVVLDMMIHDIDIVLNLVQQDVVAIEAYGMRTVSKSPQLEDIALATLVFDSGCLATILANRTSQTKIRHLNITQPNGYISLDFSRQDIDVYRQSSADYPSVRDDVKYKQEFLVERIEVHRDNPLKQQHEHFLESIQGIKKPLVTGKNDIRTLRIATEIIRVIQKSSQNGKTPIRL